MVAEVKCEYHTGGRGIILLSPTKYATLQGVYIIFCVHA